MRRAVLMIMTAVLHIGVIAAPAAAQPVVLDGPHPSFWISDPDGDGGIEAPDPVAGASGTARVNDNGATIRVRTTGLEPGHAYTMWVVFFNDQTACVDGCGADDLARAGVGAGVLFGDGKIAGGNGTATFAARINAGDGQETPPPPPPPFAFAPYDAGADNEFHLVIRSHGPKIAGEVGEQITTFGGGCVTEVGPPPDTPGDFPVPSSPGECGDIQVHIFS